MKQLPIVFVLAVSSVMAAEYDRVLAGAPSQEFVTINYDGRRIPDPIEGLLRFNTVLRLPKGEEATEAFAGDGAEVGKPGSGDWITWIDQDAGDAVYIRPTRQGVMTNLEVRTNRGNHYTFLVVDQSLVKGSHPHLQYIINPTGATQLANLAEPIKFVRAEQAEEFKTQAATCKRDLSDLEAKWQQRLTDTQTTARQQVLGGLTCDYSIDKAAAAVGITGACHDRVWTYIWAKHAKEHFAVSAIRSDGSAIDVVPDFDPDDQRYSIHSVEDHIRFSVGTGKKTKNFDLKEAR